MSEELKENAVPHQDELEEELEDDTEEETQETTEDDSEVIIDENDTKSGRPAISIKNLRKVYRLGKEKVVALGKINFDIMPGEICCILGTSGSGKSTLLNQLAGLEKPTKGCVEIFGHNISKFSENKLARFRQKYIGFVFQSYNLLPSLSAIENVGMPLMFRGQSRRARNKKAKQMLKKVGLGKRYKHRPTQMSGGQQQRVGIARAFVAKPKIVFADEPTGNLDTKTTIEVMELMVNMCRKNGMTMVLVTHDRELALFADRIITLIDGVVTSDVRNKSIARTPDEIAKQAEAAKKAQSDKENDVRQAVSVSSSDGDTSA